MNQYFILCWFFFPLFHCCMVMVFVLWICIPDEWNDHSIKKDSTFWVLRSLACDNAGKRQVHRAHTVTLFTNVSLISASLFSNIFLLTDRHFNKLERSHSFMWSSVKVFFKKLAQPNLFIGYLWLFDRFDFNFDLHSALLFVSLFRLCENATNQSGY